MITDYVDLVDKMEDFQEAELLTLDQELYDELWEFYAIVDEDDKFEEWIGHGDDPIEAYKDREKETI